MHFSYLHYYLRLFLLSLCFLSLLFRTQNSAYICTFYCLLWCSNFRSCIFMPNNALHGFWGVHAIPTSRMWWNGFSAFSFCVTLYPKALQKVLSVMGISRVTSAAVKAEHFGVTLIYWDKYNSQRDIEFTVDSVPFETFSNLIRFVRRWPLQWRSPPQCVGEKNDLR